MEAFVLDMFGGILNNGHAVSQLFYPRFPKSSEAYKEIKEVYMRVCSGEAGEEDMRSVTEGFGLDYDEVVRDGIKRCAEVLDPDFWDIEAPVYIYTHFYSLAHDILRKTGAEKCIERTFITSELGKHKIEGMPEVARYVAERHDIHKVVFVDDKLENLQAAKKEGFMTALKVLEPEAAVGDTDYTIERLGDLF